MALLLPAALLLLVIYGAWRFANTFIFEGTLSNIPGPPRQSRISGNLAQMFNHTAWQFHEDIFKKYGHAFKVYGLFGAPQLYISDPRALHHITIKDQNVYEETSHFVVGNRILFGPGLLSSLGAVHKKQRKMLNPVFSTKHMRGLIEVFYPIAFQLRDTLEKIALQSEEEINVTGWLSRAALEFIGQAGLGYTFDSLDPSKTNEYTDAIKLLVPVMSDLRVPVIIGSFFADLGPGWLRRFIIQMIPSKRVKKLINIVDIMEQTSIDIVKERRQALRLGEETTVKQVGMGKDIMSILLRANMEADERDRLTEEELIAQVTTFVFAGHDTTTGALSRILWILSLNQPVQDRLREEIRKARDEVQGADFSYDTLMGLPYLDAVCRETMRVYPPATLLSRVARKDMVLPLSYPIPGHLTKNGKPIGEIHVKEDTEVFISILAANRSKAIWGEDAEEWKPERWMSHSSHHGQSRLDEKADLNELTEGFNRAGGVAKEQLPGVYSGMMTFFGGGRACIGFKFSEMEMKLVLVTLLERLKFEAGPEIYWNMNGLQTPVIKGSKDNSPLLPLKISVVADQK